MAIRDMIVGWEILVQSRARHLRIRYWRPISPILRFTATEEVANGSRHPDGRIATGAQQLSLIRRPDGLNRVRNAGQRGMPKNRSTFLEEDTGWA